MAQDIQEQQLQREKLDKQSRDIERLTKDVAALEGKLLTFEKKAIMNAVRVRIENFEGCLKTYSAEPTDLSMFKDGSIFLIDDGGATHQIGVLIAGTIRVVAVS